MKSVVDLFHELNMCVCVLLLFLFLEDFNVKFRRSKKKKKIYKLGMHFLKKQVCIQKE